MVGTPLSSGPELDVLPPTYSIPIVCKAQGQGLEGVKTYVSHTNFAKRKFKEVTDSSFYDTGSRVLCDVIKGYKSKQMGQVRVTQKIRKGSFWNQPLWWGFKRWDFSGDWVGEEGPGEGDVGWCILTANLTNAQKLVEGDCCCSPEEAGPSRAVGVKVLPQQAGRHSIRSEGNILQA